jgi:hypothetical protein
MVVAELLTLIFETGNRGVTLAEGLAEGAFIPLAMAVIL